MASKLDIYNMAVSSVGVQKNIVDPTEASNQAITCTVFYDQAVRTVLQSAWWNFAQRAEYLALVAAAPGTPESAAATNVAWLRTDPTPPWLYSYAYPSDCIQARAVMNQPFGSGQFQGPHKFHTYTRFNSATASYSGVISTNVSDAILTYTASVTDESQFNDQFVDALSAYLASKIAMRLTGDPKIKASVLNDYKNLLMQASVSDANEGLSILDYTPQSLQVRGYLADQQIPYGPTLLEDM